MKTKVGLINIGQSPRTDILEEILPILGPQAEILEAGALDDLSATEIKELYPKNDEIPMVTRLRDGSTVTVSKERLLPRLQQCIDSLEERGARILVLQCTGEFPVFRSRGLLIKPQRVVHRVTKGILEKGKLGLVVPLPEQIPLSLSKWQEPELEVIADSASSYGRDEDLAAAAQRLAEHGVDLILLDCQSFTQRHKALVREIIDRPIIVPATMTARVVKELI